MPRICHIFIGLIFFSLQCTNEVVQEADFHPVDPVTKPWTRWWWQGSSVTEAGITHELEVLQKAGFGGVEITPIYGVIGDEPNFISYLSPTWVQRLEYTLREATRLGLGVDLATGTGWPFGGPWVSDTIACKYIAHQIYKLKAGQRLKQKVAYEQEPILRAVTNQVYQLYGLLAEKGEVTTGSMSQPELIQDQKALKISDIRDPVASNANLQGLALDQVRFKKQLPLSCLMAYSEGGAILDLTSAVDSTGQLDWVAPEGEWTLYALFQGWHGKMVERAAPGGEGNVIDHFSKQAIEDYLQHFDKAFTGKNLNGLRGYFNDSYEVDDARGQADWTADFLNDFAAARGYRLEEHLPAFLGLDDAETNARIRSDYRQTIGELLLGTFTGDWKNWAHRQHKIIRNQAHGSPANILDLYAASDIPETEGTDVIRAKMASSAAHITGKKLASAEAATWLDEHFLTTLDLLKENLDRYFQAGINHVCYHGTCYSPAEDPWPGRLFYAAIHANDRNPWWQDLVALNAYVQRCQETLQTGSPDNDVLLYYPYFDRLADGEGGGLAHFDGGAQAGSLHAFRELADSLYQLGYAFDVISDAQISDLEVRNHELRSGEQVYRVIVVPKTTYMPEGTFEQLLSLARQGIPVVFDQALPLDAPGWNNLSARQATFRNLIQASGQLEAIQVTNLVTETLNQLQVPRESLFDAGLRAIRRHVGDQTYYLITNWSGRDFNGWLPISIAGKTVKVLDPWTDQQAQARVRSTSGQGLDVWLGIPQGATRILLVDPREQHGPSLKVYAPAEGQQALAGPWLLTFERGGPESPASQELSTLVSWADLTGAGYAAFSGTARYTINFDLPEVIPDAWRIDLGQVANSGVVILNGEKIGTLIGPNFTIDISREHFKPENKLEVLVTNRMANRIIAMDKKQTFWKRFYNVNFPAKRAEDRGSDGLFTAVNWEPLPSGLLGPVRLIPLYVMSPE